MATEAERVKAWHKRIGSANKAYEEWAAKYDTDKLEEFYQGHQHPDDPYGKKYTINQIFSSIEIKIPSLLYFRPRVHVIPAPPRSDDPGSNIEERCKLREDLANTLMKDERVGFDDAHMLALRNSFFEFGVVEWGYSGDFIDNPNAGKPMLKDNSEEPMVGTNGPVMQPDQVLGPGGEFIYSRHIPACQFRVPAESTYILENNDWCGYYEWVYTADVKRNPAYKNRSQVKDGGQLMEQYRVDYGEDSNRAGMVKIWKIWDIREKKKYVWAENGDKFLVDGAEYKVLPFRTLRPHPQLKSFYPVPPVFNWIDPQRELNETRDSQRVHRKRMYRRYQTVQDRIPDEELDKMETGGDGVIIKVQALDMIKPIQDAPLDQAVMMNVGTSREDFMYVSGIGGEQRGVSESNTATQANIIDTNAKIRDSYGRALVGKWLGKSVFTMLEVARYHMIEPVMVMISVDPLGPNAPAESDRVSKLWREITMPELGNACYEIEVDIESLSPVSEDLMREKWMQFMQTVLQNPTLMMALLASPVLFRKTAGFYGIRSDREMAEIGNAMKQVMAQMATGGAAPAGPGQPGVPTGPQAPGGPPPEAIMQALAAQMGGQARPS